MDHPYVLAQWSKALTTAALTNDDGTRTRARQRMDRWQQVLDGMRSGTLHLGTRAPVTGVPVWVTPEVVRGGFATGRPAAAGPLSGVERRLAREAGVPEERGAVVAHALTEDGIRRLWDVLDAGRYEVDLPESAALLVVAWLVREGDVDAALDVVDAIRPWADTVRFLPLAESDAPRDPEVMWREDAGSVATALRRKRPAERVLRMNDVLEVWNPYADALLEHWLGAVTDGQVDTAFSAGWLRAGRELLAEYDRLAAAHPAPARHRRPKENAAALRLALAAVVGGRELTARERGRVRTAVVAMVTRRGAPGTPELRDLRARQHVQASLPTVAALAHVAADRLAAAAPAAGIADPSSFATPVTEAEAVAAGVPAGTPMPRVVERALKRATAGTLQELVAGGVVTSAELLASLVPQVTAQVVAAQYDDPALRVLTARTYEAFRRRRSLLLLDLQQQVRPEELPWVAATMSRRRATSATRDVARDVLLRLADEAVTHWPGAILPNPLVAELSTLASAADVAVPLVEEIAADIFMGRFSAKYAAAFALAEPSLRGSLYARYYRMDAAAVSRALRSVAPARAFSELCTARAATPGHFWCTVCNGMVVEQAQILTTHNLASLVTIGLAPRDGWLSAAEGAYAHAAGLLTRLNGNRQPHRMLKDVSYAWRQMVFYVAQLDDAGQSAFLGRAAADAHARPEFTRARLATLLEGLARPGTRPPLVGWGHGRHWLLEQDVVRGSEPR